jgi:hypothetical protein
MVGLAWGPPVTVTPIGPVADPVELGADFEPQAAAKIASAAHIGTKPSRLTKPMLAAL